ncbi:MAG: hypothetical protein LAQ30_08195 [Acidobacteriia bacterium]|nr:hypothetical protein [Terriglobia bacterium]
MQAVLSLALLIGVLRWRNGSVANSGDSPARQAPLDFQEDVKTAERERRCLEIVAAAIEEAGGSLRDVVRTRLMLTDIGQWQEAARAHGEIFGKIRPASTAPPRLRAGVQHHARRAVRPLWHVDYLRNGPAQNCFRSKCA